MLDWTKVLGSAVLLGGAIAVKMYTDLPTEVALTLFSIVPAMWVIPPVVTESKKALRALVKMGD